MSRYKEIVKTQRSSKPKPERSAGKRDAVRRRVRGPGLTKFGTSSFRISREEGYCAFPVGGDTYRSCSVGCAYCFSPQLQNQHLASNRVIPVEPVGLFKSLYDDPEVLRYIQMGLPVKLGVCADPMPAGEEKFGVTLDFLRMLAEAEIPVLFTTKRPDKIVGEYLELLLKTKSVVKTSFSVMDEKRAAIMEPGAPSPEIRIRELKRIREAGIPTLARPTPWIRPPFENYDYEMFRECADGITIEALRYSVLWRHTWPARVWEVLYGEKAPAGEQKAGTARYAWMVKHEKDYWSYFRYPNSELPWSGGTYGWILMDPGRFREVMVAEFDKIKKAGFKAHGICGFGQGIQNVGLASAPYCCNVRSDLSYDMDSLVSKWHENRWSDFLFPPEKRNMMYLNKLLTVNDPDNLPFELEPEGLT